MGYKGTEYSKTTYYRKKRKAEKLGCSIDEVPDMRGKHGNHARGPEHGRWQDGRLVSSHGYVLVRVGRDHPLAFGNGYVYEHHLVWISAGNPPIEEDETLHHINGIKSDNRIGNLELLERSEHGEIHSELRQRDELGRFTS